MYKTFTTKRFIHALFYCILVCCIFSAKSVRSSSSPVDTITLQLKWRNQFQFAGYYAAQIKGYYATQGLNVKILPGGPGINVIDQVINGKVDVGIFDPGILEKEQNSQRKPLTVLATIMQSSGYCIVSLKEKGILVPADLIGKKVMAEKNQRWSIFKAILLKEGLDVNKVEILDRILDSEDIAGKADAVVTYITSQPQRLKELGHKINIMRPEEYGVDFYGDFIFTTREYAYKDTEKTNKFINASLQGWKYALAHKEEIIDYILTLPDVKAYGVTREQLQYEAAEMQKLIMPDLVEIGHTNIGRWQYMLKLFQELGVADKNFSLKGFVYDNREHGHSHWYLPIIYALVVILVIVIVVVLINHQLRSRIKTRTAELRQEIEQRKIAEQLANENKEQMELILNSSNIGLWEFDIKSKTPSFNQEFKKILGYGKDIDFSLEDFLNKIHPEDSKLAYPLFDTVAKNHEPQQMVQFRVENASGEYIYILSSSKVLYKDDQPSKISGVVLSIEEVKKKELEILKVSQELIRRNNELKKFAYITSHNLRAPVVNISSLSEMMDEASMNAENQEIFEKMKRSILKLNTTLNDLVEVVAHDESTKILLERIDIEDTIQAVITAVKDQIANFDVDVNLDLKVKELTFPKHWFLSIIFNLITNAIKFNKAGRKTVLDIETFQDDRNIILKFRDNGIGIDLQKNGSKIFGLYQRINPQIEGKGFGLFIVKSHMETFNGKVEVESVVGESTTFILYFPRSQNF
ncbi:MAG TPA: ABC transporter substrate-binding protein [Pelobium sp.]|nr:ABC transporter substrate-binding protein [Pelobium sp.]